jgi:predicted transcriptional regulator of viral defense system
MPARWWRAQGVTPALLRSLIRSGQLVRMRHGVYATKRALDWAAADPVRAHVLMVMAARATVGRNAVASYHSAARLHRLSLLGTPPPDHVTLTVPLARPWNRARPANVVFHASDLPPEHLARLYNLPVTSAARTVTDLARTLPFTDGVVAADSALHQEKTTKPELLRVLEECARWPGAKQARRVVDFADERAESPLESAARVAFDQAGLPRPELQATVHGPGFAFRVDFRWPGRWPGQAVIAEADGLVKYSDRKDLLAERERDHLLREAGYTVVHFTWRELFQTPEAVLARIRRALASMEASPAPPTP